MTPKVLISITNDFTSVWAEDRHQNQNVQYILIMMQR
jgi:hypothetical protein